MAQHAHIWRLVMRKVATLEEIRRYWCLRDVIRANEFLDVQDDSEWLAHDDARRRAQETRR